MFERFVRGPTATDGVKNGRDKKKRTNILLGATTSLAVLTGVTALLLFDWKGKPKSVALGVGPGTLIASGSF